jgi:hypothetical protein
MEKIMIDKTMTEVEENQIAKWLVEIETNENAENYHKISEIVE